MAKFAFYIVDLDMGTVTGTDDAVLARDVIAAEDSDTLVLHAPNGTFWSAAADEEAVREYDPAELGEDDEGEDDE